jgi:cation transport ATPase
MRVPLRLDPRFRRTLYAVFALLFLTGAAWWVADWHKNVAGDDFWHATAAWLLMVHGGSAMVVLLLLGALLPLHAQRGWRGRTNRLSGAVMLTLNGALVATAFGLYYIGSEKIRSWMSDIHVVVGFFLPVLLLVHIALGKRTRS